MLQHSQRRAASQIEESRVSLLTGWDGLAVLRAGLTEIFPSRIAVLSSFGADSALLLALVAEIDASVPVLFLDTDRHFPETLVYRRALVDRLGLTDVRDIRPDPIEAAVEDPDGDLWLAPDACCALRKTRPLERALLPFAAWVTGRRRDQASTRATLPVIERDGPRFKINPLAGWDAARVAAELRRRELPVHPLTPRGYASIGCANCTVPVGADADPRSGRWAGRGKIECGIHRPLDREASA